ncbi:MAG: S1C family serine protease [Oscillospiraceae bacterium]
MQFDYYRSPCQDAVPAPGGAPGPGGVAPPTGTGQPRRRRRGLPVLILFSVLILLSAAVLIVLRVLSPDGWMVSWERFFQQFDDSGFYVEIPGEFDEGIYVQESHSSTRTTIPRADPAPDVHMLLLDQTEQSLSFQEIYEKVIPSIVSIQSYSRNGAYEGTGVIMTADGYVLTNHHIISGCSSADVVLSDGTRYQARLAGSDAESDLAVLKVDAEGLTPAEFGNSDQLRVGDTALAIGNPLGSELFGTLTEGIISAINRDVNVDGYQMSLIQTTAALNPGNSGGALLNDAGQVVGITNMKMMSDYETIEGLGFAIPTAWAKEVVDALLAEGAITGRPTIGITCKTVFSQDAPFSGQQAGVYVETVTAHGPAAQAGVQPGDVIIEANGQIISGLEDLTAVRDEAGVGGTLALTIWRDGDTLELSLTLMDQYELN